MKHQTGILFADLHPVHTGHLELISEALKVSDKVLVALTSAQSARNIRSPFTTSERRELIESSLFNHPDKSRIGFIELKDFFYDKKRFAEQFNPSFVVMYEPQSLPAYFLKLLPESPRHELSTGKTIDTEGLRAEFLRDATSVNKQNEIPTSVKTWLKTFSESKAYKDLQTEQLAIDKYKSDWSKAPYAPTFVTTDIVLVQNKHVLLIQRNGFPGKGLWANPGGFLDGDESLLDCAIRELIEETALQVGPEELKKSLVEVKTFDYPGRSSRGRTITHAHKFELQGQKLAGFNAGDDAAEAKWVPISDLKNMAAQMFEDHYQIIQSLIKDA